MVRDLSSILDEWPFEPGMINVRVIEGLDKEPKIQVRLDLGIIQMNTEGRPDGQRPHGYASLLEYFEARIDEEQGIGPLDLDADDAEAAEAANEGDASFADDDIHAGMAENGEPGVGFSLSPEDCRALRDEAAQYYHRYVALLVLEDFVGVIRDTTRNLRVIDLCRDHAESSEDSMMLEQVRPYLIMMRARACAGQAVKDDEPKAAVFAVENGLADLRAHFDNLGEPEGFDASKEAEILRSLRESLVPQLPVSQQAELRERLQEAIRRENYELAAILRNELRMLGE